MSFASTITSTRLSRAGELDPLPGVKLDHVNRLTDDTGMLQHATFSVHNRAEGYSIDDNARALILTVLLEKFGLDEFEKDHAGALVPLNPDWPFRYLAFLGHAFNPENKRFRNFLGYDQRWMERQGSEDSHARALWALGTLLGRSANTGLKGAAGKLFDLSLPVVTDFYSPRACAYTLLGVEEHLRSHRTNHAVVRVRRTLARRLRVMYESIESPDWKWFENVVAYGNARMPQAMLVAGAGCDDDSMVAIGLESLGWLMQLQRCPSTGHFTPIGSHGFYRRGGEKARFDQQPLEAAGAVSACLEAFRITGEEAWRDQAWSAFRWFSGANDFRLSLYDAESGGCRDGLHPDRANENQGAESTLSYLMALLEMRASASTALQTNDPH